jgi:hypothetical protein
VFENVENYFLFLRNKKSFELNMTSVMQQPLELQTRITFGKNVGKSYAELIESPTGRSYLSWLASQPCKNEKYQSYHDAQVCGILKCLDYWRFSQSPKV